MACSDNFEEVYKKAKAKLGLFLDETSAPKTKCTHCTRKERVLTFKSLKPGDHICIGGNHFMKNFNYRQKSCYAHHAIVKRIEMLSQDSCIATLIHFYSTAFQDKIKIQEIREHLLLKVDEVYKIEYCHQTYSPKTIIDRAETLTKFDKKYSLFDCNCEHFCHWCCNGNTESFQVNNVEEVIRGVAKGTCNIGGKIIQSVCRFVVLALDDALKVGIKAKVLLDVPWGVIALFVIVYLVFCIIRHKQLNKKMENGKMCSRCCSNEQNDLWLKFTLYSLTQSGGLGLLSLIISAAPGVGVVAVCIAFTCITTGALMYSIPKLRAKLSSPFKGALVRVKTSQNIWIGDVISFEYKITMHDGIVSNVQILSENEVKVRVIHYSKPKRFGRRTVEEKEMRFDLRKDKILGHNYSGTDVHSPEQVVSRARQRIGEVKYSLFSNRSCHFCHWAKVVDHNDISPEDIVNTPRVMKYDGDVNLGQDISHCKIIHKNHMQHRKHATKRSPKTRARIPEEIKAGDIIQFKSGKLNWLHSAITTDVLCTTEPSPIVTVTVVHFGKSKELCEETFTFDLRFDDIWLYKYHPSFRYSRSEVVQRAKSRISGKKPYKWTQEIVEKDSDQLITDFTQLHPGDVIVFYYWSFKHAAVVININQKSKPSNKANVTIIHYALDGIFEKRTIKKECIPMDSSKDNIMIKSYEEYVTYPPERVIRRAFSRLNEQRFHVLRNTSWDFIHWAKVVQNPAFIQLKDSNDETLKNEEERMVLFAKVGKVFGDFQRTRVHCWRDLQPGIILEFPYYMHTILHHGIIYDVDVKKSEVTVIHYGANSIASKRSVRLETISVYLQRNQMWMYICNPERCNKQETIIKKAMAKLGKSCWSLKESSWRFCERCVVKDIAEKEKK